MLPTIESLKNLGVNIIRSEVVQELHIDSEGKSYKQKLREDTFTNGAYSPLICLFYHQSGIKTNVINGIEVHVNYGKMVMND